MVMWKRRSHVDCWISDSDYREIIDIKAAGRLIHRKNTLGLILEQFYRIDLQNMPKLFILYLLAIEKWHRLRQMLIPCDS